MKKEDNIKHSKVILISCRDYEEAHVYAAIRSGIEALGGIESFVRKDEKILIKPNFLVPAEEDKAITTHPAVIAAVFRLLFEHGYAYVSYGDSPGHGSMKAAAEKLNLNKYAAKYAIKEADMQTEILTPVPDSMTAKSFYFTKGITEADAVISLCKMKTHALERITGAVKNVYGYICGMHKAAGHVSFPNATAFARLLCDIHRFKSPRLNIMDGIVAMEGNGPGSGDPVKMNLIMISADPVALDTVFCRLIDLDPKTVPTNVQGANMGIGNMDESLIDLEFIDTDYDYGGENIIYKALPYSMEEAFKHFGKPDFNADREKVMKSMFSRALSVLTGFTRKPYVDKSLCIKCGICVSHCLVPGKAVSFKNGKTEIPVYDYKKCIRCYCCQEMCPQHAIKVKGR